MTRITPPATTRTNPAGHRMGKGPRSQLGRLRSNPGPWSRLLLPLLLAVVGAEPAAAEDLPVRAGEHEEFTRLVLKVPEDDVWALLPAPGGFELRGPAGIVFDTREVFERIPRDRIAALVPRDGGRLGISIACDCHGRAFREPEVGLVVDVIDGPATTGAIAPGPVPPTRPLDVALPLVIEPSSVPLLPGAWDAPLSTPSREAARVARTEGAILESVVEAARHGFLDLAPGVEGRAALAGSKDGKDHLAEEQPGMALRQPGLALRTGAELIGPEKEPLAEAGTPCLPEDHFDLAAWSGSGDFGTEVSRRVVALIDARDLLDPGAAEALAGAYLAFGFGREASVALDMDGRSSRRRDVLRHIASLLDGESVPPRAFEDQAGCLGPVTLWRALARGTLQGTDERERTAITLALRDLPPPARRIVALRLAGLFLDAGDAEAARAMAAQGPGPDGDGLLARAEIAQETEGPEAALAELEEAAERDPRMTPEALSELLDLLVDEGRPVGEDLLELARALRFENGNPRVLLLAEARALSAEGRFEEALALLDDQRAGSPGEDLEEALASTVEALTIELDDGPFLELALSGLPRSLPPEAADAAARRLSDLGFPDEAWLLRAAGSPRPLLGLEGRTSRADASPSDPAALTDTRSQPPAAALPRLPFTGGSEGAAEGTDGPAAGAIMSYSGPVIPPPPPAQVPAIPSAPFSSVNGEAPMPDGTGRDSWLATAEPRSDLTPASEGRTVEPAPTVSAPAMSLADRRALLIQADDARARAAALLGQQLSD